MYIYHGHMGGLYTSDGEIDYEDLYCEQCGDSDDLIGYADTKEQAWKLLIDDWDYDYVQSFINKNWEGND